MNQKITPCCGKPITEDDVFRAIDEQGNFLQGLSNKNYKCPLCGKECYAYLAIEEIDVEEEGDASG